VELVALGERLRFRPKADVDPEDVELLRQHKGVVLALLTECCDLETATPPTDKTDKRLDPFLLSVLSVFPDGRVVPDTGEAIPIQPEGRECWGCKSRQRWRLQSGGPWTCARCHPPIPSDIEWEKGP
jgi:hypothetical protein